MGQFINLAGKQFGRLNVICREAGEWRQVRWSCRCECGSEITVRSQDLRTGHTKSCGCLRSTSNANRTSNSSEYRIWRGIISRCENKNLLSYGNYGGRGIKIWDGWRRDFQAFLSHIGPRPSLEHSVDRIDNDGNYEPGNVRWALQSVQCNNRRVTRFVVYRGVRMPLANAVRDAGSIVHIECAWIRIRTGWNMESALETPRLFISGNSKEKRRLRQEVAHV